MCKITMPLLLLITVMYCLSYIGWGSKKKGTVVSEQYPIKKSDTSLVDLNEIKDVKVFIYHTEPARIIVSYSNFMERLQDFIDQNNVGDDIILSEKLGAMASETDSINIAELTEETKLI